VLVLVSIRYIVCAFACDDAVAGVLMHCQCLTYEPSWLRAHKNAQK